MREKERAKGKDEIIFAWQWKCSSLEYNWLKCGSKIPTWDIRLISFEVFKVKANGKKTKFFGIFNWCILYTTSFFFDIDISRIPYVLMWRIFASNVRLVLVFYFCWNDTNNCLKLMSPSTTHCSKRTRIPYRKCSRKNKNILRSIRTVR